MSELRVHGVGGTRPEDILDRPALYRAAGDSDAAFLRPRPDSGATTGPGGAKLEAYRWGSLTAGGAARAFWLLLAPFMLANVMLWLRPPAGPRGRSLVRALCRIFALSLTVTFVLAMVGISVDLVGWQCTGPGNRCGTGRSWLLFLSKGFFAAPGRRLAVTALVPVAAITVLWLLARRTWSRYEAFTGTAQVDGDGLSAPGFWRGHALVGRLRGLHIAVAFAALDAVLIGAVLPHTRDPAGWVLGGAALLILVAVLVAICLPGMAARDRVVPWAPRFSRGAWVSAVLLTGAVLVYLMLPRATWPTRGGLPGYGLTLPVLYAGQTALLVLLAVVVFVQRAPGQFLAGLGAPVVGSLGLGLAVSFSAGLTYRVADYLDRAAVPSPPESAATAVPLQPPPSMAWAGLGFLVAVLCVALVGAWVAAVTRPRLRRAAAVRTDSDFPGRRADCPERASVIDRAIAGASMSEHVVRGIAAVYIPVVGAAIAATVLALAGLSPLDLVRPDTRGATALSFAVNLGSYLIGLVTAGLVLLGMQAYRNQAVRRSVGVLWDLGTFWPRAGHPLAPPCYAERVVPELVTRATWLASDEGGGGVVLSGHSQGSVLAAATVLQMSPGCRQRVALLTYGSPLRRLYCRLFPAYVNVAVLEELSDSLTDFLGEARWVNLWRSSDPIGGPICLPSDTPGGPAPAATDRRLVDPVAFDTEPGDTVPPAPARHSGYQATPEFARAMTDLVDRL